MTKRIVGILCSTGITLIVLALAGMLSGASFLCLSSVFESFAANVVIHLGFIVTNKLESNYAILEFMVDLGYIIAVLMVFGSVFHWFDSTPVWMLAVIGVVVYAAGILLGITRMRQEVEEINVLLSKRKKES